MSDAIKHITDNIFSFRKTAHWCTAHALCMQHSPTAAAFSTSFLLNHARNISELNALITRFRRHRAAWVWVTSQKDWRNQGATGWIVAMHCYIWVKKCDFRVSCFARYCRSTRYFNWHSKV